MLSHVRQGEDGLEDVPAWTREEDQSGARLGTSLSRPVDLNADGFMDLVVGAPGYGAWPGMAPGPPGYGVPGLALRGSPGGHGCETPGGGAKPGGAMPGGAMPGWRGMPGKAMPEVRVRVRVRG